MNLATSTARRNFIGSNVVGYSERVHHILRTGDIDGEIQRAEKYHLTLRDLGRVCRFFPQKRAILSKTRLAADIVARLKTEYSELEARLLK